jgi:uncharacterized protein (TIGR03000 family)
MYSMVLMAALSTGTATPACHWRSCHGCYGGGCHGCWGGYGGCYGCWGGYGACHGCYGGWGGSGGHGCNGYGGCYGCYGGYGGCYGCWGGYGACHGCHGGYGDFAGPGFAPAYATPAQPPMPGDGVEKVPTPPKKKGDTDTSAAARARLIVQVPADAKLYIDDNPMKTTAAQRTFNTPPLQPGMAYYYMVRAEVERDGQTVSQTTRVIVRAGEVARASFADLGRTDAVTTKASSR